MWLIDRKIERYELTVVDLIDKHKQTGNDRDK